MIPLQQYIQSSLQGVFTNAFFIGILIALITYDLRKYIKLEKVIKGNRFEDICAKMFLAMVSYLIILVASVVVLYAIIIILWLLSLIVG